MIDEFYPIDGDLFFGSLEIAGEAGENVVREDFGLLISEGSSGERRRQRLIDDERDRLMLGDKAPSSSQRLSVPRKIEG